MNEQVLTVREIQEQDIAFIIDYWTASDPNYLINMGVDIIKIPKKEEWNKMLSAQITQTLCEKQSYCIIWVLNGEAIGHSNVNKIKFGAEAYMHLHIWKEQFRRNGWGLQFIKKTLPYFFKNLHLKTIYCEPYAINPSPNNTLQKLGFTFIKKYITTPGSINFEQEVNRWQFTIEQFAISNKE